MRISGPVGGVSPRAARPFCCASARCASSPRAARNAPESGVRLVPRTSKKPRRDTDMGALLKTATHDARITGEYYAPARQVSTNPSVEVLLFDVFFQCFRANFGPVHIAVGIGGHAFARARAGEFRSFARVRIRNEVPDRPVFCAADADAAPPSVVVARDGLRFRIGDVD